MPTQSSDSTHTDNTDNTDNTSRKNFLAKAGATAAAVAGLSAAAPAVPVAAQVGRFLPRSPVTLRFSYWMPATELKVFRALVSARFEKLYPNIKIQYVNNQGPNWGQQKLETMIAGNDAPDVMQHNTGQFEAFASKGTLLALDSYFKRDHVDLGQYLPGTRAGISYGGKIYGTPRFLSSHAVLYNKNTFKKAGVPVPTSSWTWSDFLHAAQKTTNAGHHQWGFGMVNNLFNWIAFVGGNGGQVISADHKKCLLDDPRTVEALQFFFDLQSKYKVVPPPGSLPPAQIFAGDQWIAGTVAMCIVGPWERPAIAAAKVPFQWGVVTTPVSPRTHRTATAVYTDQWSVSAQTAHPEEAWQFAKWLGEIDFHTRWLNAFGASSLDAIAAVDKAPRFVNFDNHSPAAWVEELKYGSPPPINYSNGERAQAVWDQELQLVQLGQETAAQAVAKMVPKIDTILQAP